MTLKQIRQWAAAVAAICLVNVFLPFYGITAYAATARIAFSDPTASVGSEINVKMKITSSDNLLQQISCWHMMQTVLNL